MQTHTVSFPARTRTIPEAEIQTRPFIGVPFEFFRASRDLGSYATHIYIALLSHRSNSTGTARVRVSVLAAEAGMSRSQATRALRKLQPTWVWIIKRTGGASIYGMRSPFHRSKMAQIEPSEGSNRAI